MTSRTKLTKDMENSIILYHEIGIKRKETDLIADEARKAR